MSTGVRKSPRLIRTASKSSDLLGPGVKSSPALGFQTPILPTISKTSSVLSLSSNASTAKFPVTPRSVSKRKRQEEESCSQPRPSKSRETFVQHDVHWAPDGNIMVQIGGIRFKVYRSRLMDRSTWFRYLFDRQAGRPGQAGFEGRDGVENVLKNVELVGELDCFFLDGVPNIPSPRGFAELLNAMDAGINFAHNSPSYDVLARILTASSFFGVQCCLEYARTSISSLFADNWESITKEIQTLASHAILIGRSFNLPQILRRAFYDLARSQYTFPQASAESLLKGDPNVRSLAAKDVMLHLALQSHLKASWEDIGRMVECKCSDSSCGLYHHAPGIVVHTRTKYPMNPILGIKTLLKQDWTLLGYCERAQKTVKTKLEQERERIWEQLKVWIDVTIDDKVTPGL
ncbi:unnamed protein product [Cyclocybe aegerita]|uniref:BTB domain-containing protein n=1 Tax=Cyclocybe aegerita TaxID=1973307 RepID=A0A8S0X0G7_CYCAE|nr:unnamed protein product [Cyclocybe aegerita]